MAYPATLDTLTNPNGALTLAANNHAALHAAANAIITALEAKVGTDTGTMELGSSQKLRWGGTLFVMAGTNSPEGIVTAAVGSLFLRTNGASTSTLYVKESGTGSTGWIGVGAGGSGISPTLFDAQTILAAVADDTPVPVTVAVDTVVGRLTGGNIASLYPYVFPYAFNAQSGTTYGPVLSDGGKFVTCDNVAAITITIPANATIAYPVGTILTFAQTNIGQVTVSPAVGVTLNTSASVKTRARYSVVQFIKTATNTWLTFGDTEPIGENINTQTGTTYTFVASDADDLVTLNNASAITATVPTNASVAYPIGTQIDLAQLGAGQVTLVGAGGVTLHGRSGLKIAGQYGASMLKLYAADTWLVAGDMTP